MARLLVALLPCLSQGLYDAVHRIESARLYGNIDRYAYWYVDLIVGTPPQRVSVILDTGSGVCAFPCASCRHCGKHIDPAFDIAKSSTAQWAPCGRGCTGRCDSGKCSYYQGYTEGSSISGFWFQDYVRLGDAIQHNPAVLGRMGCHQNENNLFYTQKANGILGIGPVVKGGGRTLLQELFKDNAHVEPNIFAMCLAEWGGRLVVGGYNASYHAGEIKYVPLSVQTGYYGVRLTGMRINGQDVPMRSGSTCMVDSGTTYTYMASKAYRALRSAILSYCQAHNSCSATNRDSCWTLQSGLHSPDQFPSIDVVFGDVSAAWVPKAYMFRKGESSTWCYAFHDDGANANTVLGASWMLHKEIIFDLRKGRLGMAQAHCPEFRQRPEHQVNLLSASTNTTTAEAVTTPAAATTQAVAVTTLTQAVHTSLRTSTVTTSTTLLLTTTTPTTSSTLSITSSPTTSSTTSVSTALARKPDSTVAPGSVTTLPPHMVPISLAALQGANGTSPAVPRQQRDKEILAWVEHDIVRVAVATLAGLLVLAVCVCAVFRWCREREHRHVQLKDVDDSGMPPQIVGSVCEPGAAAGPDTFVIGDDDDDDDENGPLSEDAFWYSNDTMPQAAPPPSPRMGDAALSAASVQASSMPVDLSLQQTSWSTADAGAEAPVFSGSLHTESSASVSRGPLD